MTEIYRNYRVAHEQMRARANKDGCVFLKRPTSFEIINAFLKFDAFWPSMNGEMYRRHRRLFYDYCNGHNSKGKIKNMGEKYDISRFGTKNSIKHPYPSYPEPDPELTKAFAGLGPIVIASEYFIRKADELKTQADAKVIATSNQTQTA